MNDIKGIRTLVLNQGSAEEMRTRIRHYFHKTFDIYEKLYESLSNDDAFYLRADPLRHPLVFYLGHTAVFYINKLNIARIVSERINPAYESMFAVGVDEMSWDDLNEAHYNWPSIPEVRMYRDQVREFVDKLILSMPLSDKGITWESPWWAIIMGIEHERIHLETSSVLIRQLPIDQVQQLDLWAICPESGAAPANELLPVKGGRITLGKSFDAPLYGWDNEYGSKDFDVEDFEVSRYLVSNQEFLEFVKAGGYQHQDYWTEEGWAWKSYQQAEMPRFWIRNEAGEYSLRTMASIIPMPWNHPVEVNYLEAKAFCNWKALQTGLPVRLPTEAEWYCLRDQYVDTDQPYWEKAPGNINLEYYASACPVDRFQFGDFYDLIGNVWQWTETPISAFPGFKIHPIYDDFSVPTFDTRHNLIKGGSFISTGNEAIRDSRYAFRRHFYQHAGFRYISSKALVTIEDSRYEDDPELLPWCDLDWDTDFCERIINQIRLFFGRINRDNALCLGCKTGRMAFELARYFGRCTGLDATARLIRLATGMKESGMIRYIKPEEGEIFSLEEKALRDYNLDTETQKVEFWQADVSNLVEKFSGYDLVLALGTLEEAINPQRFLEVIPERIKPRGLLIIADSYQWNPDKTMLANRLGGIRKDGEPYRSLDALKDILNEDFILLDKPFNIWQTLRLNERKYIQKMLQVSVWQKRD
ncbi:MAG TPA: 5-histidylcysteine sulfoxide synthase [Candidatus Cloacimonadota bacterium]|nr:5-histidylcysteine sulfoxide synthase [Candidatus Cloacimonadota bacterium]